MLSGWRCRLTPGPQASCFLAPSVTNRSAITGIWRTTRGSRRSRREVVFDAPADDWAADPSCRSSTYSRGTPRNRPRMPSCPLRPARPCIAERRPGRRWFGRSHIGGRAPGFNRRTCAFANVGEREDRSFVGHRARGAPRHRLGQPRGIGRDVDRLAVGADGRIAIASINPARASGARGRHQPVVGPFARRAKV